MTRALTISAGLILAIALLAALSLSAGKVMVPLEAWWDRGDPRWPIIFELRIPRTLLAILVGAALGVSGAAMQGYTRNPLADPGVLGVSAMAALGAVLSLYLGAAAMAAWVLPATAIVGAVTAVVMLMMLAGGAPSSVTFVLAGVVLQTVAGAGTALALTLAPDPWAVSEIMNWLMGSLADRSAAEVWFALPPVLLGAALLLSLRRSLDALTLGETGAQSLGVSLRSVRWRLAAGVGLATGASVAVTGIVGFVGLIVPHILRPFVGARPGALLIPSALGGAVLTLAADILVRMTPSAVEIRLGAVMAAIGGPFFLAILLSRRTRLG